MSRYGLGIVIMLAQLCTYAQPACLHADGSRRFRLPKMALCSNLLGDITAMPNIGFEVSLGGRWAVDAAWTYAWWSDSSRHRFLRTYGGHAELRYFLGNREGRNSLEGHHIGIYGQMFTYDFEWGGTGYMAPRWSGGGGIAYGYTLPVSAKLSLDFTLGIGYIGGRRYKYEPAGDRYVWLSTKNQHYIGPTRLEVSLLWLIGNGNRNPSKEKMK